MLLKTRQAEALFICDFEAEPMSAGTFTGIAARLDELRAECRTTVSAIFSR